MTNMTKEKKITYRVEGPDWDTEVELDTEIYATEPEQLFEAGTRAIESMIGANDQLNIGAILLIKRPKSSKEAMVNSYICLVNAAQYKLAEELRENFKKTSGQDLALDETGYSY
jgi:hypothetical protein